MLSVNLALCDLPGGGYHSWEMLIDCTDMVTDVIYVFTSTHTRMEKPAFSVVVFFFISYLCLETSIRNRQCSEAVWDSALTLCCRILYLLVIHHPRHYTAHSGVHQKASSPSHPRLSAFMLSASLTAYLKKGSSFFASGDEARCGKAGVWHQGKVFFTHTRHRHSHSPSVQYAQGVAGSMMG